MIRKILIFLLMLAILVVLHYTFKVIKAFRTNTPVENTWKDSAILYSSIAYILTIIFSGLS